jgi:hypothetical protein
LSELINLSTAEEAEGLLRRLLDEKGTCSVDPQKIKFSGVLSAISFKIEGERYHGTLPANLARCVFRSNWTLIPRQTGHLFHGKLITQTL